MVILAIYQIEWTNLEDSQFLRPPYVSHLTRCRQVQLPQYSLHGSEM